METTVQLTTDAAQPLEILAEAIVTAIIGSTKDLFTTMLGSDVQVGDPFVETSAPGPADGVVALVGMAGDWAGTGSVSLSANLACRLAGTFMMVEYPAINDEVLDAVAEISNMIVGNIKNRLETVVGAMALSIPTVVFGRNFAARSMNKSEWHAVPFTVQFDDCQLRFDVQVCLEKNIHHPVRRPGPYRLHAS
jgi:chemotaxis protein CheX